MADTILFPEAFRKRMQVQLQSNWTSFDEAHQQPAPTSIRLNPFKKNKQDLVKIPWTSFGFYHETRPSFTFDPHFHAGAYYVQEASSMFFGTGLKAKRRFIAAATSPRFVCGSRRKINTSA